MVRRRHNSNRGSTNNKIYGKCRRSGRIERRINESGRRINDLNNNPVIPTEINTTKTREPIVIEACESPRDGNGNLLSIPIKLEMERREDEKTYRTLELMEFYRAEFIEVANKFRIFIVSEEEMQIIADGRRYIILFQAVCADWQSTLTPFLCKFLVGISWKQIATDERPVICTHSLLLYPLRLVNIHQNVPLGRIQFGSLINNGRLGVHWTMTGGSPTRDDPELGFNFHKGIYAFFEYDKRNIAIEYCNVETDPFNRDMVCDVHGKISLEMSSINRIIFDQIYEHGQRRSSLVLLLDFPPKFQTRRRTKKSSPRREVIPNSHWEYRAELHRGEYPGETSHKEALHDSKAIILQFDTIGIEYSLEGNSSIDSFFHDLLSRLRHKTGKRIEFASLYQIRLLEGIVRRPLWDERGRARLNMRSIALCPYYYNFGHYYGGRHEFDDRVCRYIMASAEKIVRNEPIMYSKRDYHVRWKAFRLRAVLQGILDKGMEYRIELLCDWRRWYPFIQMVSNLYELYEQRTLDALERVMSVISDGRPNCSIPLLFQKEWGDSNPNRAMALFSEQDRKNGFQRIMKLVVTPTRVNFVGYEVIMGNRVLNKYAINENHIIRVAFRDDRGAPLRPSTYPPEVQARIKLILIRGITYAGRTYAWLGNSNSQLREQGCYMMHIDFCDGRSGRLSPHDIRIQMGDFHLLPNIPKMLARLGQVFTQCKPSETALCSSQVGLTPDFVGGRNATGKPYVFSDGVGRISALHATTLSREHGMQSVSSAYQIRFRGEKGMLCMDPLIDDRNALRKMMGKDEEVKKVFVRPSMIKFQVMENRPSKLEIVKSSYSSAVFLNRPFINILCQVSEKQSEESHARVKGRIKELLHSQLRESIQSLYVERKAHETIREMSFPLSMEVFTITSGLHLTKEPFFRSLLHANMKYILQRQLQKMNIRIPSSSARSMFGVVDDSGVLQYGQIFCQYTGSMSKTGGRPKSMGNRKGIILTGPTLITKNPCISSGDVRMFDAVDVPSLHHLADVVVFPIHGPRPHPDEMAGSDLDGDEYLVIWDKELFLERNEEASVFPMDEDKTKWAIPVCNNGGVDWMRCEERKAEFFTEAIVNGQPGMLCTAHLAASDLYGLDSKPSTSLAMKIAQTLDYQKSGVQPDKMTVDSVDDPMDEERVIPAEKTIWKPDFLRCYRNAGYESRGILGEAFREVSKYESGLDCGEGKMEKVNVDSSFLVDGWKDHKKLVEAELGNYSHAMKSVIEHYGVASEEEMLCGMILSVIEGKVKRIQEAAREKFFDPMIDWRKELEDVEDKRNDVKPDSILNKRVKSYTRNIEEIRRKAAAAYSVAYERARESVEKGEPCAILLSFPWLFYDVLMDIKTRPEGNEEEEEGEKEREDANEPLAIHLSELIDRYTENHSNEEKLTDFKRKFERDQSIVNRSMMENEGLMRTAFVLVEWAKHIGSLNNRFGESHLLNLFVMFGLGELNIGGPKRRFLQKPGGDMRSHLKKGEHLLEFMEFVSSREFRVRPSLSLTEVGGGLLIRGEWRAFSETSLSSFLSLVMTHRLDLPIEGGMAIAVREYEPRVMQLPDEVISSGLDKVREALRRVSGCRDVKLRMYTSQLAMVSALGTSEQLRILSSYIYPPAPTRESATVKGKMESMAAFTYDRLMVAVNGKPSPSLE